MLLLAPPLARPGCQDRSRIGSSFQMRHRRIWSLQRTRSSDCSPPMPPRSGPHSQPARAHNKRCWISLRPVLKQQSRPISPRCSPWFLLHLRIVILPDPEESTMSGSCTTTPGSDAHYEAGRIERRLPTSWQGSTHVLTIANYCTCDLDR
jgi:hypothetical protein